VKVSLGDRTPAPSAQRPGGQRCFFDLAFDALPERCRRDMLATRILFV